MRYGSRQFRNPGQYRPVQELPTRTYAHFSNFLKGYDSSDASQDTSEMALPYAKDVEVTVHDTLKRCPGVSVEEAVTGHVPYPQMILHASLDNRSELLLISPPYIGVKTYSSLTWQDVGLLAGDNYAYTNFGGSLIMCNGIEKVFVRQAGATTVEVLEEAPVAKAYATFAGRVWAGGATIDGQYEPMGLMWSSAFSNYEDWTGIGSGFELLIANVMSGDRVIALQPMGLDFMAVVCRRSIWIARRTALRDRPADFQPRVPGVGAINQATVAVTRFGVIFLSDSGVFLFDGNNAECISRPINRELLPIDYNNLNKYSASYNPFNKRYYLHTPTETWVYDLDYNRWFRRSLIAIASSVFTEQFDQITWAELTGTWADQNRTWASYSPEEGSRYKQFFLANLGVGGYKIGYEDDTADDNFSTALVPILETKVDQSGMLTDLIFIDDILLNYQGSGQIELWLPDLDSAFEHLVTIELPTAATIRTTRVRKIHSGHGMGLKLVFGTGDLEISRMSIGFIKESPRIETPPTIVP